MFIIRILKVFETLKKFYETLKTDFIKVLSSTKAECTLPIDFDDLEKIARCIFPDIIKYYEEKRKPEASVPLTDDAVLSDNKGAENIQHDKGGIKI